jgi:cytochrome P450
MLPTALAAPPAAALPAAAFRPPRPQPRSAVIALIRTALQGDGDLLSLLPAQAYRTPCGYIGWSRRSMLMVNAPELVRSVLTDTAELFPKSDLMVNALAPLVGDSMFVSSGDTWRRQRRMIDPAFSQLRVNRAFEPMTAAVDDHVAHLHGLAARGEAFSLDLAMSHLTADIICRTVFSTSLQSQTAREVFDAFTVFERSVAQTELRRLILDPAWTPVPQPPAVLAACARIRAHLGTLLDSHLADRSLDDIAAMVVNATDGPSGHRFSREELLDQLGVLFLAGHETTASVLTWAFFILAQQPAVVARMRAEVAREAGTGPLGLDQLKRLSFTRNVFRETLRLYPPITFLPRVALAPTQIGRHRVRRGALIMVAPWTLHRHGAYWAEPDRFDPDRFAPEREAQLTPGAYIPFGLGPRVCIGAAFATTEATLILARLVQQFDFHVAQPEAVRPVARLTTRPAQQIMATVRRHGA